MIDKQILHCKIFEKLGEGGMGVVYKAEDSKLERLVAIKFLPHHIAANAEERERFKIEAKAAAALNHPNIATIYAIEEVEGEIFIVMACYEGETLAAHVARGKLQMERALAHGIVLHVYKFFGPEQRNHSASSRTKANRKIIN